MVDGGSTAEQGGRRDLAVQLRDGARVIREQLWLIALCVIAGLAAGWLYSSAQDPIYQSTAKLLLLQSDPNAAVLQGGPIFTDPARERATDIELVQQQPVAERVARRLRDGQSAGELLSKISTDVQGDSNVLSITASDDDPGSTAEIANAFAREFVAFERETQQRRYRDALDLVAARIRSVSSGESSAADKEDRASELRRLQNQAKDLRLLASLQTGDAQVIETAAGRGAETSAGLAPELLLGGLLGLLVGLGVAFLRDRLDPRVKSEEQLRAILRDVPIIARIPRITRKAETRQAAAERFHLLRADLEVLGLPEEGDSFLLVTSAMPGEGKSSTAANLALASAQRGEAVTLVEADLRNPELSRHVGLDGSGMADVLRDETTAEQAIQPATLRVERKRRGPRLALGGEVPFIPAGAGGEDHWRLFKDESLSKFLEQLSARNSLVVIDGPPLGLFSDMAVLARLVDEVVVVVQLGQSRKRALMRLEDQLARAEIRPVGVVLLGASVETSEYRSYSR